jgi:hypothetical protein
MLDSLKSIDQEWEAALTRVIEAFKRDWQKRKVMVCTDMVQAIDTCLSYSLSEPISTGIDAQQVIESLNQKYKTDIKKIEQQMFNTIRARFKHHLFDYQLPDYSILAHDLFSKKTWELLGLTKIQLAGAGAVVGSGMGAFLDTAAAGITFGVFTAIGGVLGAGSALFGGKKVAGKKPAGFRLGGDKVVVGPNKNPQFFIYPFGPGINLCGPDDESFPRKKRQPSGAGI